MTQLRVPIVGSLHHPGAVDKLLAMPLDSPVSLIREPDNPYDPFAVACYAEGVKLGFIPKSHSKMISAVFDEGKAIIATLLAAPLMGGFKDKPFVADAARMMLLWE